MKLWLVLVVVPILTACATYLDSSLDDGTKEGLRYSLPQPFLVITPQGDGTLTTKVEHLPDPTRTYVLRTRSIVSSYTLDVQLTNQILTSVSLGGTSDAVAKQVATSAGNVAAAGIDRRQVDAAAAQTAAEIAATALSEAELNVLIAQGTLDELKAAGAAADILLQARLELVAATIRREALLRASGVTANALPSGNNPAANSPSEAAGPMIFRIVSETLTDGRPSVRLIAVNGPTMFPTSTVALPRTSVPRFTTQGPTVVRVDTPSGDFKFDLTFTREILAINSIELYTLSDTVNPLSSFRPTTAPAAGSTTKITILLSRDTPAGPYFVIPVVRYSTETGGETTAQFPIEIQVIR